MVRRRDLGLGLASLAACGGERSATGTLVLRNFRLVDPAARRVDVRDVVIEQGKVVERSAASDALVIEGRGRFLLPALWDLKASLWGNNSALNYDVLQQAVSFTRCLEIQLFYGVAHVGVYGMDAAWAGRYVKRADALEIDAAEPLYPDRALGARDGFASVVVKDRKAVERELVSRRERGYSLVHLLYETAAEERSFSLSRDLLGAGLGLAKGMGLTAMVMIDDWQRVAEAVTAGARLLYGLPDGVVPTDVVELMRSRGAAFAPALCRYLELDRLLGEPTALDDPFLTVTTPHAVRASFREEKNVWADWRKDLALGRARKASALASVRALAEASVPIVVATDAGWTAGTFQGYSSHAAQRWLEVAGLSPWSRLAAATSAPALAFGRSVGFEPGHAADFVGLGADPLASAASLRRIELVIRRGKLLDREGFAPDLTRSVFKP